MSNFSILNHCIKLLFLKKGPLSVTTPFVFVICFLFINVGAVTLHAAPECTADNVGLNDSFIFFFCSFTEKWIPNVIISHRYKAQDTPARRTFEQALTGAFMSAVIKDLRPSALPFVASLIRHYTMVAVAQQCGTL